MRPPSDRPNISRPSPRPQQNRPGGWNYGNNRPRPPVIYSGPQRPPHRHYSSWRPRPVGWGVVVYPGSISWGIGWGGGWYSGWYFGAGWNTWATWPYYTNTVVVRETTIVSPAVEVQPAYTQTQSAVISQPSGYNFYDGVRYNPLNSDPKLKLDIYSPISRTIGGNPCIVLLSGSTGPDNGDRKDLSDVAEFFAQNGYVVAAVSYRTYPAASIKESVEDSMRALFWLRDNATKYGGNPYKIGVVGCSGGGYLAEMLAIKSDRNAQRNGDINPNLGAVSACVAIASPSDVYNYSQIIGAANLSASLGSDSSKLGVFEGGIEDFSPIDKLSVTTPPMLIINAEGDSLVPFEQSVRMQEEASARGAPVTLRVVDGAEHRIWEKPAVNTVAAGVWYDALDFLNERLK